MKKNEQQIMKNHDIVESVNMKMKIRILKYKGVLFVMMVSVENEMNV